MHLKRCKNYKQWYEAWAAMTKYKGTNFIIAVIFCTFLCTGF